MWTVSAQELYKSANIPNLQDFMEKSKIEYIKKARERKFIITHLPKNINHEVKRHNISYQELLNKI